MREKNYGENLKVTYALSLVGRIGFYIAIPFLAAILGGQYLDRIMLDKYLLPGHHAIHHIFVLILTLAAGVYSVLEIRELILPLMYNDNDFKNEGGVKKLRDAES